MLNQGDTSKAYLKVAKRQLAMAESLLEKEFYEGVMFHSIFKEA
ncbi:MAG: hypothetical protein QME81_15420 [bacterium]|nr:hypothetical protein [bacterium]